MRASFTVLIVYFFICLSCESKAANKFYNRGWIPLSNEEVFHRMKIHQPRDIDNIRKFWHPSEVFVENVHLKNDVIKLVRPLPIHDEFFIKRGPFPEENLFRMNELGGSECAGKDSANCPETGGGSNVKLFDDTHSFDDGSAVGKNVRVAKKIADYSSENLTRDEKNKTVPKENAKNKSLIREVRLSSAISSNTYEVTEEPDEFDMLNEDQSAIHQTGYVYNRPEPKTNTNTTQLNSTNPFLSILSKYKTEKDEQNYVLSRRLTNQNDRPEFVYVPIPLRPRSFNSFNHLPVNPMLAAFLSNYGYYIPGAYGARNNFSNLYGYLASNNFHNNQPYGMYKVFSDTDSSN